MDYDKKPNRGHYGLFLSCVVLRSPMLNYSLFHPPLVFHTCIIIITVNVN